MAHTARHTVHDWVDDLVAEMEKEKTVAKAVAVLLDGIVAKAKEGSSLDDLQHHGNKIAAAVAKGTAAEHEPLN